jgi:hypothetical protein
MIAASPLTYGCIAACLILLGIIAAMWRAIWRDRRELDERDRRETEDFGE